MKKKKKIWIEDKHTCMSFVGLFFFFLFIVSILIHTYFRYVFFLYLPTHNNHSQFTLLLCCVVWFISKYILVTASQKIKVLREFAFFSFKFTTKSLLVIFLEWFLIVKKKTKTNDDEKQRRLISNEWIYRMNVFVILTRFEKTHK